MEVIFIKIARIITAVLLIASGVICCGFLNIAGGYALIQNTYESCGKILIISSAFLIPAVLLTILFKLVIIPSILNILGTGCYLYTINVISNIPDTLIPKENTQILLNYHLPTISVTILIFLMAFFNFMSDDKVNARRAKKEKENRKLTESEKIV